MTGEPDLTGGLSLQSITSKGRSFEAKIADQALLQDCSYGAGSCRTGMSNVIFEELPVC